MLNFIIKIVVNTPSYILSTDTNFSQQSTPTYIRYILVIKHLFPVCRIGERFLIKNPSIQK